MPFKNNYSACTKPIKIVRKLEKVKNIENLFVPLKGVSLQVKIFKLL